MNLSYESRFRGGILLLGFLLCPTAQRKSQTSMKTFPVLMFVRMLMGCHEKIFLKQLIERFKGGNNINKGNNCRKKGIDHCYFNH